MNTRFYLTLFISSFSFLFLSAQEYQPLVIEGAHWQVYYESWGNRYPYGFSIEGDSTYNGVDYKKVYKLDLEDHEKIVFSEDSTGWWYEFDYLSFGGKRLFGLLRENTVERKVYSVIFGEEDQLDSCQINEEQLLYDFSVEVGDTIVACTSPIISSPGSDYTFYLTIDSVWVSNIWGEERRVLFDEITYQKLIEGLGYEGILYRQILYGVFAGHNWTYLWDYCIGTDEECLLLSGTNDIIFQKEVRVSPNPFLSQVNIDTKGKYDIVVFDLLGKVVFQKKKLFDSSQLDLSYLRPGSYFIKLIFKDGEKTVKIIK